MLGLVSGALVALLATAWLASRRSPFRILDVPNERSLHARPVPRTGGLGVLLGIFTVWGWQFISGIWEDEATAIALAAILVAAVSFWDDLQEVAPSIRLLIHFLAASMVALAGIVPWPGLLGLIAGIVAIVWMLNLYNFMDGMDGFAGSMTIIGMGSLALAAWMVDAKIFAFFCAAPAVACLGFLAFNWPPAKIFLGDVGSATLGLIAGAASCWGIQAGYFSWWFPLFAFGPFVVDATVTLFRRAWRRERVWQAHREHYYQRLVRLGWGHRRVLFAELGLMVLSALLGFLALRSDLAALVAACLAGMAYLAAMWSVDRAWRKAAKQ